MPCSGCHREWRAIVVGGRGLAMSKNILEDVRFRFALICVFIVMGLDHINFFCVWGKACSVLNGTFYESSDVRFELLKFSMRGLLVLCI